MKVKCIDCGADTDIPLNFEELVKRYTPYPILCWYCHKWYAVYHDVRKMKMLRIYRN